MSGKKKAHSASAPPYTTNWMDNASFLKTIPEDKSDAASSIQLNLNNLPSSAPSEASSTLATVEEGMQQQQQTPPRKKSLLHGLYSADSTSGALVAGDDGSTSDRRTRRVARIAPKKQTWRSILESKKTRRLLYLFLAMTVLFTIAIILIVVLTQNNSSANEEGDNQIEGEANMTVPTPSALDTPFPTKSPTAGDRDRSAAPTPTAFALTSQVDSILFSISDPRTFDDPTSPQSMARTWLLEEDLLVEDALYSGHLPQRYIAAELLYAVDPVLYNDYETEVEQQDFLLPHKSECDWKGFTCPDDMEGHVVTRINLSNANLTGSLPKELAKLSSLQELRLDNNRLLGDVPEEYYEQLDKLYWLDLSNNLLSGTIPEVVWSMPLLRFLDLNDNRLSGPLSEPRNVQRARILQDVWLGNNQLSGPLPSWLMTGFAPTLSSLQLANNSFTGPILPSETTSFPTNLTYLDLSNNTLTGTIPTILFTSPSLKNLYLETNQLQGSLTNVTGPWPSRLEHVWLHSNRLEGEIPTGFATTWPLHELLLYDNDVTGVLANVDDCSSIWPALERLEADCEAAPGSVPQVTCTCCTECYV